MPSGYTSELYDGKPQTFEQFVLQCARAFGATIMQRDDPWDAPLRLPKPSTDYSAERLAQAQNELDRFRGMPAELVEIEAEESYLAALDAWKKAEKDKRDREERYRNMLADVMGWVPPTAEHEGLKEFMIQQLEESIRFDCSVWDPPVRKTADEYRAEKIESAERDIRYHTKSMAEEIERTNGRRGWITDLAESLGVPVEDDVVVPT